MHGEILAATKKQTFRCVLSLSFSTRTNMVVHTSYTTALKLYCSDHSSAACPSTYEFQGSFKHKPMYPSLSMNIIRGNVFLPVYTIISLAGTHTIPHVLFDYRLNHPHGHQ